MHRWKLSSYRSLVLLATLLLLGICFRFVNLDKKVYWHDEIYTSLRITAHSGSELAKNAFTGQVVNAKELLKYQQLDSKRSLALAIHLLGVEDSQHPPLYYVTLRFWVQWLGNSVAIIRSWSAWISILVFPAMYWLCRVLFASSQIAWVAVALTAVSPIHVLFAQEARQYSLWFVTTLLMSAAFLQAIQRKNLLNWGIYTITIVLSLYTFLFSGLVMLSHGIYLLLVEGLRLSRTIINYLAASFLAILAFTPWIIYIATYFNNLRLSTSWTNQHVSSFIFMKSWVLNLSYTLLDLNLSLNKAWEYYLVIPVVLLEAYSIYFLCKNTTKRIYLFVLTLAGVPGLALALPDLVLGGQRSISARYLIPCFLGMQLSVSYLLATQMNSIKVVYQRLWRWLFVGLLTMGIVSCIAIAQADTWWNKVVSYHNPEIARIINKTSHPLLISDSYAINGGNVVSLSYLLDDKVKMLLLPPVGGNPRIPNNINIAKNEIFFLNLPQVFINKFKQKYHVEAVPVAHDLWQVKK